jgi:type I restriction enzyme, S subunit
MASKEQDWLWVSHNEIADINPPKPQLDDSITVSFVPMGAVAEETGEASLSEERNVTEVRKGYTAFQDGDILFAKITPCMENGKVALVDGLKNGIGFGSTEFHVTRLHKELCARFYLYYFLSHVFRKEAQGNMTGSAGQLRVPTAYFREVEVPLPPVRKQHRIVAKIEELFSELDKGVENLKTARAQLKTYRQSLLKAAFEGRLTEQWRRDNADKLETADQLLQRIRDERKLRYSQQLASWKCDVEKWKAENRMGSKPKKPSLPKGHDDSLSFDDVEELPQLPRGWKWVRLGDIAVESVLGKMLDKAKNKGEYRPYLRNVNVRWGKFELNDVLKMKFEDHETARYSLNDEDLVVCEGGEPGRSAVWRKEYAADMRIQKALHRVRFAADCVVAEYVRYFFLHSANMFWLDRYMTGTTIKHLTGKGLSQVPVPVCSPQEQSLITDLLEARTAQIEHLERTISTTEEQISGLRQSILKRAFEGKLVPQDPNDEPASALLERIRAKQEKAPKPRRRRQNGQGRSSKEAV